MMNKGEKVRILRRPPQNEARLHPAAGREEFWGKGGEWIGSKEEIETTFDIAVQH